MCTLYHKTQYCDVGHGRRCVIQLELLSFNDRCKSTCSFTMLLHGRIRLEQRPSCVCIALPYSQPVNIFPPHMPLLRIGSWAFIIDLCNMEAASVMAFPLRPLMKSSRTISLAVIGGNDDHHTVGDKSTQPE